MDEILELVNNPIEVFEETSRLLLKIADNVLNSPNNPKVRILQKSNETIKQKILNVCGGRACLKAMGFEETELCFKLPITDSLCNLKQIRFEISRLKNGEKSVPPSQSGIINIPDSANKTTTIVQSSKKAENPILRLEQSKTKEENRKINAFVPKHFKRIVLPPYTSLFAKPFLKEIEALFHRALHYDNSYLQERALSVIPSKKLENNAQVALRALHEKIKKEKLVDPEVNLQDFLILELLSWFKNEFFEWVSTPSCIKCNATTTFSHMSSDKDLLKYTNRVEMHKCNTCNSLTPFPRYTDLNILLETRKGRCGEWANTFTLMCRAMGWDTRFVIDQTDHVWTEVYSFSQRRWLHCDPCENICDKPLIYEHGWKKKISYVIAFSGEEIQDVTWRYSSKHKEVMKRRTHCTEDELIQAMCTLRDNRQATLSRSRQEYLRKRLLSELVELMLERQPTDNDKQGRISGTLDWRLARGELRTVSSTMFTWEFTTAEVSTGLVSVQYSSALNQYRKITANGTTTVDNWDAGVFKKEGVFRKVEEDWKKAYLCRMEQVATGEITWKFRVVDPSYRFDTIEYIIEDTTFEDGSVVTKFCTSNQCELLKADRGATNSFAGSNEVMVTTKFLGGKGENAWQQAQLCREDLSENENVFTFKFVFTFQNV